MKNLGLFFMIFLPFFCFGQVNENFLDGNFINNPIWTGDVSNFIVNSNLQLQSQASVADTSSIFTTSEAIDNATWECWVKMTLNPSSSNNASVIIVSDRTDIPKGFNGYYVQIGGYPDEVSLFLQQGTKNTRIISGINDRTNTSPVEIRIKVTRDAQGWFELFTKLPSENDFVSSGKIQNLAVKTCNYYGLRYMNTKTYGSNYYFDDIVVTGNKAVDTEAPTLKSIKIQERNNLLVEFSEPMDYSSAAFSVDKNMGVPTSQIVSLDKSSVNLIFGNDFERGNLYQLQLSGLKDLAGNKLSGDTVKSVGISESIEVEDLIINEIMFENPDSSAEYIEIYNKSNKLLDLSRLVFTTRKTDGSLNTGNTIPTNVQLLPKSYLCMTSDMDKVRKYHNCPPESNIINTEWATLNNESATIVLCNLAKDTVFDELNYNTKWHHVLVKNPKGVALERINPDLPTQDQSSWHSAASEFLYGTPGYKNSQFREIDSNSTVEKTVWVEPEAFSPDNDGVDDVCFIRYKTEVPGYVANALILNSVGVPVYHLATNTLLGNEGFFTWDGKTDAGKNANVGIYVLYFEQFNPTTGMRKQQKLPIVVSAR